MVGTSDTRDRRREAPLGIDSAMDNHHDDYTALDEFQYHQGLFLLLCMAMSPLLLSFEMKRPFPILNGRAVLNSSKIRHFPNTRVHCRSLLDDQRELNLKSLPLAGARRAMRASPS